jgi:DNA topoisomerase-3
MKVCIAEKPSVAKEIAKIIGANKRYDGYFEGNGYQVTWTFGHFCTLYEPEKYHGHWKRWDLNSLPMLPKKFYTHVLDDKGIQKQYLCIKNLLSKADEVINCGDAGQEGELIQRWVINETGYSGKITRLWISSLTNEAIEDGFKNLRTSEEFDNLYYAGFSRAIGDWLLGINATRLFTLMYAKEKQVLSIGRVQTPTLAMIVERFLEIENFVSKPYWEIQTLYRDTPFQLVKGKFNTEEKGSAVIEVLKQHPFKIVDVEKKKGKEAPPRLFDLTSLQVECNKKYGFTADQTLKLIQGLYEKKVVTYPRVDTTYLPTDMYPKIGGILKRLSNYQALTQPLLGNKIRKSKKVFDDKKITDHHAIIPTGEQIHLQPLEFQVYDTIVKRFISVFYEDCIFAQTIVKGKVEKYDFKTTGKIILEKGWRKVYEAETPTKKSTEDKTLPPFEKDEEGEHNPELIQKKTNPPKHFTEATLLRSMETAGKNIDDDELRDALKENGIGRPSTRASIIETLFKRKYIKRNKKQILPTAMGVQLIDLIDHQLLKSAELTGKWEKQLREIEAGDFRAQQFIHNMKKMVDDLVLEVRMNRKTIRLSERMNSKSTKPEKPKQTVLGQACPKCSNGSLILGKTSYGCNQWKAGCTFRLPFTFLGKKISENQWLRLLQKGETVKMKGFTVEGEKQEGKIALNEQKGVQFFPSEQVATPIKEGDSCPTCKKGTIIKGKTAFGCSEWKSGCGFRENFSD